MHTIKHQEAKRTVHGVLASICRFYIVAVAVTLRYRSTVTYGISDTLLEGVCSLG